MNFAKKFLKKLIIELDKYPNINKYIIDIEKSKKLYYKQIYSPKPIELETIKTLRLI